MAKRDRLVNEKEHHCKAFEAYYELGEQRSYQRLAGQLGVAVSTVKLWARSFGWQRRVREREAEVARRVADRTLQSTIDEGERNQKIVQMAVVRLARAIAQGKVRMQVGDLDRLIRLQAFLEKKPQFKGVPQTAEEFVSLIRTVDDEVLRETIKMLRTETGEATNSPAKAV